MKQEKIALKTMGIKASVYNQIRTDLYKKRLENITPAEKEKLFDKWFGLNSLAHTELNNYKSKRQYKTKIQRLREERKKNLVDKK
jgi:hypothetical protein